MRFKIKNRKIFGIPLYNEPGMRPGNAPEWVYRWWKRAIKAWTDLMGGVLIAVVAMNVYALHVLHQEKPWLFYRLVTPKWSSWQEQREAERFEHTYGELFGISQ